MAKKKIIPKTQAQLSQASITPYDKLNRGKEPLRTPIKRAENRSVKNDEVKQFHIGLRDIDETIVYYFNEVIKPSVVRNGKRINVPVLYGSPERWASIQKDGFYRDKNGKIQTPLIMFKRDSIEKNRQLGNKLDANLPNNFGIFKKKFSKKNVYDRFSALSNRTQVDELYGVIIPDYVNISYSCVIFTEYVEQMNKIVESINFASDAYWGDPEKFKFRAMIDSYSTTTEMTQGQDRMIKTNFDIKLLGHIVPDSINTSIANMNKFYSKSAVKFTFETAGSEETLIAKAGTSAREAKIRTFDGSGGGSSSALATTGLSGDQITYLNTNNTFIADSVSTNTATFTGIQFIEVPTGFTVGVERFSLYINGQFIPKQHYAVSEVGGNINVVVNTTSTEFAIDSGDQIILTGKIQ